MNATAEYVIVPNVTSTAMAAWAASRPLSILANNDNVSAVRDIRNGALGITFWRAGAIDGIQSNAPAVVYLTTTTPTTMQHPRRRPHVDRDRHVHPHGPRRLADERRRDHPHHALDHGDDPPQRRPDHARDATKRAPTKRSAVRR